MTEKDSLQKPLCGLCGRQDAIPCKGVGTTLVAGVDARGNPMTYTQTCPSLLIKHFNKKIGPNIAKAPFAHDSPFASLLKTNVFITAERRELDPHLKTALWKAGPDFFFRLTTDAQVLDAWLSKERAASAVEKDYSSLRDLVEQPDLLILYLGVVSYPNRALPGIIQETLELRGFEGKPTWVVTSKTKPLVEGLNLCYSADLVHYLQDHFVKKTLQKVASTSPGKTASETDKAEANPGLNPKGLKSLNNYF